MDCIVLAGGVPKEEDPLYAFTQGRSKALLDLGGRPMIAWVLDALQGAELVGRLIVVGLELDPALRVPKLAAMVPDQKGIFENLLAGVDALRALDSQAAQMLVSTSDIPLIKPYMVDELIRRCGDVSLDVHYTVVERTSMEARFPGSRRTYVHLSDGDFAGGDIFVARPEIVYANRKLWNQLLSSRKYALRQARRVGILALIRLLLGRLSLAEAERRASVAFGITGRAVVAPYPELGMDVDKPGQYEICRQELAR